MPTLVMKFGGTSVADPERIRRAARRVAEAKADGHQVAVVVSAMGHTTDELIGLAGKVAREPARRELDALMSTGEAVSAAQERARRPAGVAAQIAENPQDRFHRRTSN